MGTTNLLVGGEQRGTWENNLSSMPKRVGHEHMSRYGSTARAYQISVYKQVYDAVYAFKNGTCFVGITDDGTIVVERDGQVIARHSEKWSGFMTDMNGAVQQYAVHTEDEAGCNGVTALIAAIPQAMEDTAEFQTVFAQIDVSKTSADAWSSYEIQELAEQVALLGDNIYRRAYAKGRVPSTPLMELPESNDDFEMLNPVSVSKLKIKEVLVDGPTAYCVKPQKQTAAPRAKAGALSAKPDIDTTLFGEPSYTEAEKRRIPEMPKGFRWARYITEFAGNLVDSFRYSEPLQVSYFVGPASCGKSMAAKAIASMLKLVYTFFTCDPDTDVLKLFGDILPNTSDEPVDLTAIREEMGLPSEEDITEAFKSDASAIISRLGLDAAADCGAAIARMVSLVNAEAGRRCKDYTYVEGPLTKALKRGYLLEIQEVGVIRRPGVVVALNAILESGFDKSVTLPTGEVVKKDPHCILIFTSNDEYEGTVNLNQSVLSRMADVQYFANSSSDEMVNRTLSVVTDFADKNTLARMAETIQQISEYCNEHSITDGVCGQRELTNWAMRAMSLMRRRGEKELSNEILRESCQTTVLNKVSQSREQIVEVANAIVDAYYGTFDLTVN